MPRHKRPPSPMLGIARDYLRVHNPELKDAPLHLHRLDGPPDAPRYAVDAGECVAHGTCPYHVPLEVSQAGKCPIINCALRHSIRLLLDAAGNVVTTRISGTRWE